MGVSSHRRRPVDASAEHALASGSSIAVFPGGDHEALRPFWQVENVDFGGRLGFLRSARKAWVPIVPMGIRAIRAPLLFRSRAASYFLVWPRVFGLPRGAVSLLGLLGAAAILAWGRPS